MTEKSMKRLRKIFALLLAVILSINIINVTQVRAENFIGNQYELYEEEQIEVVNISGVNYTYSYFYENGNRTILITNDKSDTTDKVCYNENNSTIYLNGEVFAYPINISQQPDTTSAEGWQTISSSSHYISWAKGTTVGVVAAALAAYLGTLGAAGVIAAMGTAALGTLASNAIGGTLYVKLQEFYVLLSAPQYRFEWRFTASTGTSYGPYYYHYYA